MARVIGSTMRNVVPRPTSLMISTFPSSSWMFFLATSSPTPRPEISLTAEAVEKPGVKSSSKARAWSIDSISPIRPRDTATSRMRSVLMPRPSSVMSMTTEFPFW